MQHAGDYENAMIAMNDARECDLQDRFINSKCTKYMLRNDQVDKAENTITMFVRVRINQYDISTEITLSHH
jgi:peptide alpha-N-acetyltransferase